MKIQYTLTNGHIWRYHWYVWRRRFLVRLTLLLGVCLLIPCLNFIPSFSAGVRNGLAPSAALAVVIFVIQFVTLLLTMVYRFWKALKPGVTGERVAEAGKFDLRWGSPQVVGYYHHWSSFEDIVSNKDFLFFILKGNRALIIPKSAFTDLSKAAEFFQLARKHWEIAQANQRYALTSEEGVWPPPPRIEA